MRRLLVLCVLLLPTLAAAQQPVITYFPDQAVIKLDVTNVYAAVGRVTRAVKFANPEGTAWDLQVLYIDIDSETEQKVEWDTNWQTGYGLALPTKTTPNMTVRWGFVWNARKRTWNLLANTQVPTLP